MFLTINKFDIFKKECLRLVDLWELNNWTLRFYQDKNNKKFDGAWISRVIDNCQADIYFINDDWNKTKEDIKTSAKHEMIHVLLGKLYLLGMSRWGTNIEYSREEEELVHKLEKLLI